MESVNNRQLTMTDVMERLQKLRDASMDVRRHACDVREHLYGPTPQGVEKDGSEPSNGMIHTLLSVIGLIEKNVAETDRSIREVSAATGMSQPPQAVGNELGRPYAHGR